MSVLVERTTKKRIHISANFFFQTMVSLQLDPEYGWVLLAAVATYSIEKWMVSYKIVIRLFSSDKTNPRQIEF